MSSKDEITVEVDSNLLAEAQKIFEQQGFSLDEAIELFFRECIRQHRFPPWDNN